MLPRIAAITMAYNEAVLLPIWARHYARQVGADQCYVIDHGSTDPVVLPPGMNTLRLPRSPHDDERRARFVSTLAASLLTYYDWVLYTDVDELLLADPGAFRDLPSFCASVQGADTVTAIGFDVQHLPDLEPALDATRPFGQQRGWARFTSAMCKPVLTRQALAWAPGFHCSEHPLAFDRLYLFHLHWADLTLGLERLRKTRHMAWCGEAFGHHQRVADREWLDLFDGMASLPRLAAQDFDPNGPALQPWLARTTQSSEGRAGQTFSIDLSVNAAELWPIPHHFRALL